MTTAEFLDLIGKIDRHWPDTPVDIYELISLAEMFAAVPESVTRAAMTRVANGPRPSISDIEESLALCRAGTGEHDPDYAAVAAPNLAKVREILTKKEPHA